MSFAAISLHARNRLPALPVSFQQIAQLARGEAPGEVLKGLGMKKFCYHYKEDFLGCCVYGRDVEYTMPCMPLIPRSQDAFGIAYCEVGGGSWDIVFKDSIHLSAYQNHIVECGYTPVFQQWQQFTDTIGSQESYTYLTYVLYGDMEFCDCVSISNNGDYYTIHLECEPREYQPIVWLSETAGIFGTYDYFWKGKGLTDMSYERYGNTYYQFGRNVEYNNDTFELRVTGPDALFVQPNAVFFSNRQLMKLYLEEARERGYLPTDTLGWKDIEYEGSVIGQEMVMYKNQDGLFGGWYGDAIRFIHYADYSVVMSTGASFVEQPEPTRQPAITIADLELLAAGQTTVEALRQKLADAGQGEEMAIENEHSISFKDRTFIEAYELEARELGYNVDRKENRGGWNITAVPDGPDGELETYMFLILFKNGDDWHELYINYANDDENSPVTLSLF